MAQKFTWRTTTEISGSGEFNVARAQFGDGYAQDVALGINNDKQMWTVQVVLDDVAPALAFIREHKGYQKFWWRPPGEPADLLWTCRKYTPSPLGTGLRTLTLEFEQAFDPSATVEGPGTGGGGGEIEIDPLWANVAALLHFDGGTGSSVYTDATGKVWTADTPASATLQPGAAQFGATGLQINSTRIWTPAHEDFNFGAGDWCIEGFFEPYAVTGVGMIMSQWVDGDRAWVLYQYDTGFQFSYSTDGLGYNHAFVLPTGPLALNTKTYIKFGVEGGFFLFRFDGTLFQSPHEMVGGIHASTTPFAIGSGAPYPWAGEIDELRITKGNARSASQAIPTTAFPHGA